MDASQTILKTMICIPHLGVIGVGVGWFDLSDQEMFHLVGLAKGPNGGSETARVEKKLQGLFWFIAVLDDRFPGKGEKYSWGSTLEIGMQQSSSLFLEARTPIPKSTKAFRLEGLWK